METLYAVYLARRIHYRRRVGGRAHLAGTDRVVVVEAVATEILGGDHAGRFVKLIADQLSKLGLARNLPGQRNTIQQHRQIVVARSP